MEVAHIQSYARQLYEAQGSKAIVEAAQKAPPTSGRDRVKKRRRGGGSKLP
jgi:hypothetical protein